MRRTLVVLLVALIVVAAVVAFAPASLLDNVVFDRTHGRLHLADAHGSILHGRGVVTDAGGALRMPIAWRVALAPLLGGNLEVALEADSDASAPRGTIAHRDRGWVVSGLDITLPAQALRAVLPPAAPTLGGTLRVSAPDFRWQDRGGEGRIDVGWSQASVTLGDTIVGLGDVRVVAAAQGRTLRGTFDNQSGDVAVNGEFSVSDAIEVRAALKPAATASPEVLRALAALGTPDANGVIRVAWRGRA